MSIFASASFTVSSDVDLATYTGEVGGGYTDHPHANYTTTFTIDAASDRIWSNGTAAYYVGAVPPSADYYSAADFWHVSTISQNVAVCARMHETDDTMYLVRLNGGTIFEMRKIVATVATTLTGGTSTSNVPSAGNFTRGKLVVQGDQLSFYVLVAAVWTLIIGPITDTSITAAGRAGVRNAGAASATTGMHLDNFEAGTLDVAAGPDPSFRVQLNRPAMFLPGTIR